MHLGYVMLSSSILTVPILQILQGVNLGPPFHNNGGLNVPVDIPHAQRYDSGSRGTMSKLFSHNVGDRPIPGQVNVAIDEGPDLGFVVGKKHVVKWYPTLVAQVRLNAGPDVPDGRIVTDASHHKRGISRITRFEVANAFGQGRNPTTRNWPRSVRDASCPPHIHSVCGLCGGRSMWSVWSEGLVKNYQTRRALCKLKKRVKRVKGSCLVSFCLILSYLVLFCLGSCCCVVFVLGMSSLVLSCLSCLVSAHKKIFFFPYEAPLTRSPNLFDPKP
jgi:hypothetical protein